MGGLQKLITFFSELGGLGMGGFINISRNV